VLSVCTLVAESVAEPDATPNVTVAPLIGVPDAVATFTTSDCGSAEPTIADCPSPLNAVTEAGTSVALAVMPLLSLPHAPTDPNRNMNAVAAATFALRFVRKVIACMI
jgi:hypothetical protein